MFLRCVKSLFRENHVFLHLHFLSIIKHWLPKHLSHAALSLTSFYFTRSAISTLTAAFLPCDMPLHQYKWIFAVHMLPVCWLFIIYSSYNIKITAQRNTPEPKSYSFGLSYMVSWLKAAFGEALIWHQEVFLYQDCGQTPEQDS